MKRILKSSLLVVGVAAIAGYATFSFFSDTETSTGNTFTAGKLDLLFQKVDGGVKGLIDGPLFDLADLKPGDSGERTVSLAVDDNPACGSVNVHISEDKDNSCTEPEGKDENKPSTGQCDETGELNDKLNFFVWRELDCDNKFETGETALTYGTLTEDRTYQIGELPTTHNANVCYGIAYCFGSFDQQSGACNGTSVNNESQSDSFKGDITITATQKRNQYPEGCPGGQVLFLENEDMTTTPNWTPKTGDGKFGLLTWKGNGQTFDYSLSAQGLPAGISYSLIYYADPYPGNKPGALIGQGTTDVNGNLNFSDNKELNLDLPTSPDTNIADHGGAKIWLIPSDQYNEVNKSVIGWSPTDNWLFEGNVYINYNDTGI